MIGQSSSSPPSGWLLCDGSKIPSTYPELAQLLPNGFLPDLRDYVLVGAGSSYTESQKIGAATHILTLQDMPSHQHFGVGPKYGNVNGFWESKYTYGYWLNPSDNQFMGFDGNQKGCYLWGTSYAGGKGANFIEVTNSSIACQAPSDNTAFSLMQPSYAVNYYIYAGAVVVSASEEKGNV
jgi:microcystin-dependent protein